MTRYDDFRREMQYEMFASGEYDIHSARPTEKEIARMTTTSIPSKTRTSRTRTVSEAKVPPIKMNQEWMDYLAACDAAGAGKVHRVLATGIPGTGKTYSGLTHGVDRDGVVSIYVGEETAAYQITGMVGIRGGDTVWEDAPGLIAWRNGLRLVVNEIDKASGDALDALIWILDDMATAQITLPTGEIVRPKPGFHVIATTNASFEEFQDTHAAVADRFAGCVCHISSPHPEAIMALPQHLWKAASALTSEETPENKRVSIRQFRGFNELVEAGIPESSAARMAFHDRSAELLATIKLAAKKEV